MWWPDNLDKTYQIGCPQLFAAFLQDFRSFDTLRCICARGQVTKLELSAPRQQQAASIAVFSF
jgi:hypothetical protein